MCPHRSKSPYDIIVVIEFLLGVIFLLYYFWCEKIYEAKVSILYLWLIAGSALVPKAVSVCIFREKCSKAFKILSQCFDICVGVVLLLVLTFSVSVISGMREKGKPNCDYLIVPGAVLGNY